MFNTLAVAAIYALLTGVLAIGSGVFATKTIAEIQKVATENCDDPSKKESDD